MNEIWKDIPEYEGLYQVSNLGRVKSLPKKLNNRYSSYITKEKILKLVLDDYGYYLVGLYKNRLGKNKRVHQLVAMAFLNHSPCSFKLVVDHIDGNPSNNNVENLQLLSNRENTSKGYKNKSSRFRGVCWHKIREKWIATGINRKYLGYFNSEIEAFNAVKEYEKMQKL